jgi:very-short-patch-repair endonuclease
VRIKSLREEVQQLNPGAAAEGLWAGIKTRVDHARSALKANTALHAARMRKPFSLEGLGAALEGYCGERWIREVQRLKTLLDLDHRLTECASLSESSHGLWQGHNTDSAVLRSALAFERERLLSNHRYYGGGLVTFPSPVTDDRAVSFHLVKGRYEKGGARINQPEAQALVADLVSRLKRPGFRESGMTIGVVTFNSEQQGLIEDLLDDERRKDPGLEPYFSEMELEPVFVKNLESVQGDERDIMYFSIAYGPDMAGAVSMNFGPLNRDGGERRLNVAVTRARHELRVFSSLRGEQMDLSRTKANGVRDLKHFLEFAELGPRALAEVHHGSQGDFESPFEASVATALGRKGWQVHTQIGASSFRVDLGVVHPDFAGRYLAGVECDGATYHRSATARDRDKLREQVLRGLGWEIVRIWSTDWWVNPGGTLERVHAELTELLEEDRERQAAKAQATLEEAVCAPNEDEATPSLQAISEADAAISRAAAGRPPWAGDELEEADEPAEAVVYARLASAPSIPGLGGGDSQTDRRFQASQPTDAVPPGAISADLFYESSYDAVLQPMVEWTVQHEGPVLDAVLARRIARAHGFQRTGNRIQERVEQIARRLFKTSEEAGGTFYWPREVEPCKEVTFRWPTNDDSTRGVEEICEAELLSLARLVLQRGHSGQDALIAMARELGLQRLREASRSRLELALTKGQQD